MRLHCDKLLSIATQQHHSLRKLELRMPRKVRELKAQIAREGFVLLPKRGKGSHQRWRHPLLNKTLTISGKDGDDVPPLSGKTVVNVTQQARTVRKEG